MAGIKCIKWNSKKKLKRYRNIETTIYPLPLPTSGLRIRPWRRLNMDVETFNNWSRPKNHQKIWCFISVRISSLLIWNDMNNLLWKLMATKIWLYIFLITASGQYIKTIFAVVPLNRFLFSRNWDISLTKTIGTRYISNIIILLLLEYVCQLWLRFRKNWALVAWDSPNY